nr:hypothetical protein [Tanacetum cinerariifolium]
MDFLENPISSKDAIWVIFGDFNAVISREERAGLFYNAREANAFNDFLARVGLLDFQLRGRCFM